VAIFWGAVNTVYEILTGVSDFSGATQTALWVALFTVALKIWLTIFTQNLGQKTKNPSVIALAYDHRNDIFSALAAVIGIFGGRHGYIWLDPLAGALVSLVLLRTGIEILRDSTRDLMGTLPGKTLRAQIIELLDNEPGLDHIDEIIAHRFGPYLVVNLTVCVDGRLTVIEGDEIATRIEKKLLANIEFLRQVHVHYHPFIKE
jgi:cation diffusion facilitator family transporter